MLTILKNVLVGLESVIFVFIFFWILLFVMDHDWIAIAVSVVIAVAAHFGFKKLRKTVAKSIKEKSIHDEAEKWCKDQE